MDGMTQAQLMVLKTNNKEQAELCKGLIAVTVRMAKPQVHNTTVVELFQWNFF